jgi:hypothetical protein
VKLKKKTTLVYILLKLYVGRLALAPPASSSSEEIVLKAHEHWSICREIKGMEEAYSVQSVEHPSLTQAIPPTAT